MTLLSPPSAQPRRSKAALAIFAILSVLVAGAAGYFYWAKEAGATPRTAEETVGLFLSAVFTARDPGQLDGVICQSWEPTSALSRTLGEFPEGSQISWQPPSVVSSGEGRTTLNARLGVRQRDDVRPSYYQQWRFSLVDEDGWRVCEARPFVTG